MAAERSVMAVIRAARPRFRNNHDKVAFAVHSSFLASGYVLISTGRPAFADGALSSASRDEVGIDGWNEFDEEYAFVYLNPEKGSNSKKVLVKCLAMDDKLLVDAIADGGAEPVHLEIDVENYINPDGEGNYSEMFKNLGKLVSDLQKEVLGKLDGESQPSSSGTRSSLETSVESRPHMIPPGSRVPDLLGPQIHPSGAVVPPVFPGGFSDSFPGGVRGGFGDGSMLVGPDDPRFFRPFGDQPGFPDIQPGVPPGARFDPYGPPNIPGFEPSRFTRQPPRRPGRGTHPDVQHFPGGTDFI